MNTITIPVNILMPVSILLDGTLYNLYPNRPDEPDTPVLADSENSPKPIQPLVPGEAKEIPKTSDTPTYLVFSDQPDVKPKPFSKQKIKKAPLAYRAYHPKPSNSRIGRSFYVSTIKSISRKEKNKVILKRNHETNQNLKEEVSI